MKVKTKELTGAALDWAVAIAEGFKPSQLYIYKGYYTPSSIYTRTFNDDGKPRGYITGPDRLYSHKWEAGGPIIEREQIAVVPMMEGWEAQYEPTDTMTTYLAYGPTPLTAAMRCFVVSKLGDEVEIPDELVNL